MKNPKEMTGDFGTGGRPDFSVQPAQTKNESNPRCDGCGSTDNHIVQKQERTKNRPSKYVQQNLCYKCMPERGEVVPTTERSCGRCGYHKCECPGQLKEIKRRQLPSNPKGTYWRAVDDLTGAC